MGKDALLYQLALTMIPKFGAITAKKLIAYVGSPEGVFREKASSLRLIPGIGSILSRQTARSNYLARAEEELKRMERYDISSLYYQDPGYPWRLKECEDGPLLLFYRGSPDFEKSKYLSIVGTRNATAYGKGICSSMIANLAERHPELVIISGMAYGIDICAHRSALENGLDTFAVLAHGLHTLYPSVHSETAKKMLSHGGLLSDFTSDKKAERNNFLRRNRIIAGLAEGTLVIESGIKGGALITAEIASSYNREVMAVPGRTGDKYSAGCNLLIRKNIAALTDSADEVEALLGWETKAPGKEKPPELTEMITEMEEAILMHIIEEPGIGLEILSVRTEIPVSKLMGILLQMEFKGWIAVAPGNLYRSLVVLPGGQ